MRAFSTLTAIVAFALSGKILVMVYYKCLWYYMTKTFLIL